MKSKLLLLGLVLSQTAFAGMPPKPASCPSASAIQAVGVNAYEAGDTPGTWIVGVQANNYGTPNNWTFAVLNIPAPSGEAAMKIAKAELSTIGANTPPEASPIGLWICLYQVKGGYWTAALTPVNMLHGKSISSVEKSL